MTDLATIQQAPEALVLARMEVARQQLAEARSVGDAKRIADGAAAICEWLRRQTEVGLEIVNDGFLLKLQAEARMGEFLGRPGAVAERGRPEKTSQPDTFSAPTHKDLGLTRAAAQRYREVATVPADTLRQLAEEATNAGRELTRESVLKVARKFRPQEPALNGNGHAAPALPTSIPAAFHNQIVTGDARDLAAQLPDASVSLCFCDPVYERIEDYAWLARECERVLVDGGNLVVQCGNMHRFKCEVAMRESGLAFVDLLAEVYPYALCQLFPNRVMVGWKPYLWFSKGKRRGEWAMNRLQIRGGKSSADESKDIHPWGDSEQLASGLIPKLCGEGEIVWDPYTGSGTVPAVCKRLGIPFVAFEIDAATADAARDRLNGTRRDTSPQGAFELEASP